MSWSLAMPQLFPLLMTTFLLVIYTSLIHSSPTPFNDSSLTWAKPPVLNNQTIASNINDFDISIESYVTDFLETITPRYPNLRMNSISVTSNINDLQDAHSNIITLDLIIPDERAILIVNSVRDTFPPLWELPQRIKIEGDLPPTWVWRDRQAIRMSDAIDILIDRYAENVRWDLVRLSLASEEQAHLCPGGFEYEFHGEVPWWKPPLVLIDMAAKTGVIIRDFSGDRSGSGGKTQVT